MIVVACEQTDEEETGQLSIAQMVQHCSANAEAMSSNPVEVPKFFLVTLQCAIRRLAHSKKKIKWNLIIEGIFAIRINDRPIGPMRCFC